MLVRDASQCHLVATVLFSEALLSGHDLDLLASFVPFLLILIPEVLLIKTLLIFNLHVDWVVHQTIILNGNRQFFAVVKSMSFGLLISLVHKGVFFGLIIVLTSDRVEIIALPVSSGGLGLHDLIVGLDLGIMVRDVLVGHRVVLSVDVFLLKLVVFTWGVWWGALLWGLEMVLLHVNV